MESPRAVEGFISLAAQLPRARLRHAPSFEQKIRLASRNAQRGRMRKTVADCEMFFYCSVQNLFSRECTQMNTNSFIAISKMKR